MPATAAKLDPEVAETPEPAVPTAPVEPTDLQEALAKSVKTAAKARKAAPKAKAKPAPKAKKPAAPKAKVEHVTAAEVLRTLKKLGMSQSQFARAAGVSSSLVCEWVGKGRGKIATRQRWAAALSVAELVAHTVE